MSYTPGPPPSIGQKLKYLRTHYTEYTQEEVADLLDIPRQTYGRYESDYRNPKHDQIIEFAKFYGISSFFFCDNDFSYIQTETSGDVLALIIENIKLGVLVLHGEPESDGTNRFIDGTSYITLNKIFTNSGILEIAKRSNKETTNKLILKGQSICITDGHIEHALLSWHHAWQDTAFDRAWRWEVDFCKSIPSFNESTRE